jgi:hypothetical protein
MFNRKNQKKISVIIIVLLVLAMVIPPILGAIIH